MIWKILVVHDRKYHIFWGTRGRQEKSCRGTEARASERNKSRGVTVSGLGAGGDPKIAHNFRGQEFKSAPHLSPEALYVTRSWGHILLIS